MVFCFSAGPNPCTPRSPCVGTGKRGYEQYGLGCRVELWSCRLGRVVLRRLPFSGVRSHGESSRRRVMFSGRMGSRLPLHSFCPSTNILRCGRCQPSPVLAICRVSPTMSGPRSLSPSTIRTLVSILLRGTNLLLAPKVARGTVALKRSSSVGTAPLTVLFKSHVGVHTFRR